MMREKNKVLADRVSTGAMYHRSGGSVRRCSLGGLFLMGVSSQGRPSASLIEDGDDDGRLLRLRPKMWRVYPLMK
jgi:hypothetical protein